MALMPQRNNYIMPHTGLSAQQKALVGAKIYDEAKYAVQQLAKGIHTIKQRKRRRRRRARQSQINSVASIPQRSVVSSPVYHQRKPRRGSLNNARMAANAITTPIRQTYQHGLNNYNVRHKEFIQDVNGSVDFSVAGLRINPSNALLFPWLARIAQNFERYRFRRLVFKFKTQTSTTTPGSLMLAVDYDPTDPLPASKTALLQYDGSVRGAAWDNISFASNPKMNSRELITSPINAATTADSRLNDFGILLVATQGQNDTSVISELWVEYDIDLIVPQAGAKCPAERVEISTAGVVLSDKPSGGQNVITSIAATTSGGSAYGVTFSNLLTGLFELKLSTDLGSPLTVGGQVEVNGVASTTDQSLQGAAVANYGLIIEDAIQLAENDVVSVKFGIADVASLGNLTLTITELDPTIY